MWSRFRTLWNEIRLVGGTQLRRTPLIVLLMLGSASLDLVGVALIAPFLGLIVGDATLLGWFPAPFVRLLGRIR